MTDADLQLPRVTLDVDTPSESGNVTHDARDDAALQSEVAQLPSLPDELNPRSPKRRRLSPPQEDAEIDFEAAAARALAISLGVDHPSIGPVTSTPSVQQNGPSHTPPVQSQTNIVPPHQQTQIDNLPALDVIATDILSTLAKLSHLEIGEMLFGPPSQRGQDYRALKARFEQAKRIYLTGSPFVSFAALGLKQADQIETIRKTNMATFMASIFSGEIGLRIMDINFLDVFVPEGGRLLKAQGSIYLELKTQAFIAAKRTAPAMLNQVMLDLFPEDVEKYLVLKRPGAKSLAPSELDFLKRLASRREILYADMRNKRLDNLELRYRWDDFSREVNSYLSKNYDQSASATKEKADHASPIPARAHLQQDQMESQFSLTSEQIHPMISGSTGISGGLDVDFNIDDFMAQAARAAEIALQGGSLAGYVPSRPANQTSTSSPKPPPVYPQPATLPPPAPPEAPALPPSVPTPSPGLHDVQQNTQIAETDFQQYKPVSADKTAITGELASEDIEGDVPHKSQTAPTQVLYERARLVTTNKASPLSRKPNPPSHRRPWTNEEENALMTGLDQVKGPHWSQILAMYGPGGTINESLKDRNQVQLKDKARNLKLFFLKAGIEVPYYLQAVTGDLKTRAPGQAEKREARERERNNAEEDDMAAQQDDLQLELGDDVDLPASSMTDQEDIQESTPTAYQPVEEQQNGLDKITEDAEGDGFDMEAMIARAAASATQSLGSPWP